MRSTNLWRSFGYAFAGIFHVLRTQRNFRIHLAVAAIVTALSLYVNLSWTEWSILIVCIILVLFAEMINTALEAVVDLASPNIHPLAKIAKDVTAGAVLVVAIGAALIGLLLIGPHLFAITERQ